MMNVPTASDDTMDREDVPESSQRCSETILEIDLSEKKFSYLTGHEIQGKIIFPAMGYLTLAWKAFATLHDEDYENLPVAIEEIRFCGSTEILKDRRFRIFTKVVRNTGEFTIRTEESVIATGKIRTLNNAEEDEFDLPVPEAENDSEYLHLTSSDVYKILKIRGHNYKEIFGAIRISNNRGTIGEIDWHSNWVTFIDTIFQFKILSIDTNNILSPLGIEYAVINPLVHKKKLESIGTTKDRGISIYSYPDINIIKSGGIELRGIETSSIVGRTEVVEPSPKYEYRVFVPYENLPRRLIYPGTENSVTIPNIALTIFAQIIVENIGKAEIKAVEVAGTRSTERLLAPVFVDALRKEADIGVDMGIVSMVPEKYAAIAEQHNFKMIARNVSKVQTGENLDLIIASDILTKSDALILENLEASLRPGGFLILEESLIENDIPKSCLTILQGLRLVIVAKRYTNNKVYILLKYKERTIEPTLIFINETYSSWLEDLKGALKKSSTEGGKILLVSQSEKISGLIGLANCIRHETGGKNVSYVSIEDEGLPEFSSVAYSEQLGKQLRANVLKDGQWGSYRYLNLERDADLRQGQIEPFIFSPSLMTEEGLSGRQKVMYIDQIYRPVVPKAKFCQTMIKKSVEPQESTGASFFPHSEEFFGYVTVHYSSLNVRYFLEHKKLPSDQLPASRDETPLEDYIITDSFSGSGLKTGRIMGILLTKIIPTNAQYYDKDTPDEMWTGYSNRVNQFGYAWAIPKSWSYKEAATVPVAYALSYHCLVNLGRLTPGESILVHDGTKQIGQASIIIALQAGCKVFTTVDSNRKLEFLKRTIPELKSENILLISEKDSFESVIRSETLGKGLDLILNLQMEETPLWGLSCLTENSRVVEIKDVEVPGCKERSFTKNLPGYRCPTFSSKTEENYLSMMKTILDLVEEGIESGVVRPLESLEFTGNDEDEAFTSMDSENRIGEVLVKLRDEKRAEVVDGVSRVQIDPRKSYIFVESLEDFGIDVVDWIIARGARLIVLVSSSEVHTGFQAWKIRRWREVGVNVKMLNIDVTMQSQVEKLLIDEEEFAPPVGGIFALASVERGGLLEDLREEDFQVVSRLKIDGTKYLDMTSRLLCPPGAYFVVFSSPASRKGRAGEANHGYANSAMESIIEKRRAEGFSGIAIQLDDDVDRNLDESSLRRTNGYFATRCLKNLDFFLQKSYAIVAEN